MSSKASDREKRRAAALRQNLKRRKAAVGPTPVLEPVPPPQAGGETLSDRPNTAKKPH